MKGGHVRILRILAVVLLASLARPALPAHGPFPGLTPTTEEKHGRQVKSNALAPAAAPAPWQLLVHQPPVLDHFIAAVIRRR